MLELTGGEWFLVTFITVAVVSTPAWPRAGEWIGARFERGRAGGQNVPATGAPE